jgi:allophanate hydrolase subunit 1
MDIKTVHDLRRALRAGPYAWPGGYPLYFVADDAQALSFRTVRENLRRVLESVAYRENDGWRVVAIEVNYEDNELVCAHTGEPIESAYGDEPQTQENVSNV